MTWKEKQFQQLWVHPSFLRHFPFWFFLCTNFCFYLRLFYYKVSKPAAIWLPLKSVSVFTRHLLWYLIYEGSYRQNWFFDTSDGTYTGTYFGVQTFLPSAWKAKGYFVSFFFGIFTFLGWETFEHWSSMYFDQHFQNLIVLGISEFSNNWNF